MVLDRMSLQENPVNARVLQGSSLGPTLFLPYINDIPDDAICDTVILLSMLMIPLSILSVISCDLICGNNLNWFLNLNLIYKTLWTGTGSCLLFSMLGKLIWFRLTSLITLVLLMQKWMGLFLRKSNLLRC